MEVEPAQGIPMRIGALGLLVVIYAAWLMWHVVARCARVRIHHAPRRWLRRRRQRGEHAKWEAAGFIEVRQGFYVHEREFSRRRLQSIKGGKRGKARWERKRQWPRSHRVIELLPRWLRRQRLLRKHLRQVGGTSWRR